MSVYTMDMRHLPLIVLVMFFIATVAYVVKERSFTAVPGESISVKSGSATTAILATSL